jgi:hypothetical protein
MNTVFWVVTILLIVYVALRLLAARLERDRRREDEMNREH